MGVVNTETGSAIPNDSRNDQQPGMNKAGAFNGTARLQRPTGDHHRTPISQPREVTP
jgi:hypothetical protein